MKKLLTIFCLVLLVSCYPPVDNEPKLTSEQKKMKSKYVGDINWNTEEEKETPPLKVIKHGYKLIKIQKKPFVPVLKRSDELGLGSLGNIVTWGWIFEVENLTDETFNLRVKYILKDVDGFLIDEDDGTISLSSKKTETIRSTSEIDYNDVERIYEHTWEFNYQ